MLLQAGLLWSVTAVVLPTGCDGRDWLGCRANLTRAIFNSTSLPSRTEPDYTEDRSTWAMHGCGAMPGQGSFVGNNSWTSNLQVLVWQIDGMISLNSTVFYSRNTSGSAPGNSPPPVSGDSCDGPRRGFPGYDSSESRSDTVVLYHNGHSFGHDCTPNYNTVADFLNQLGYDVMELFMPLHGCNRDNPQYDNPTSHNWFAQWEVKGDFPIRYFIEPVILTINYAIKLGYKHIIMAGLSGGGWSTTVAAAIDPRISLSMQIAGSIPRFGTPLYPAVVPDCSASESDCQASKEPGGDYEQDYTRPMYSAAGFVEMYVLAALEDGRQSLQMLHEWDSCCHRAGGLHDEIVAYNRFVQAHTRGWFQTTANFGNFHEVNFRDKVVLGMMIESKRAGVLGKTSRAAGFGNIPFDVLPTREMSATTPSAAENIQVATSAARVSSERLV